MATDTSCTSNMSSSVKTAPSSGEKKKLCHVLKEATTAESSRFCFMLRLLVKFRPQEKDNFAAKRNQPQNLPGKVLNQSMELRIRIVGETEEL